MIIFLSSSPSRLKFSISISTRYTLSEGGEGGGGEG